MSDRKRSETPIPASILHARPGVPVEQMRVVHVEKHPDALLGVFEVANNGGLFREGGNIMHLSWVP